VKPVNQIFKGYVIRTMGKGLLGRRNGDVAEVAVPVGTIKLEILEIFGD
jgi:transcription elongation GreA/GreB family factor